MSDEVASKKNVEKTLLSRAARVGGPSTQGGSTELDTIGRSKAQQVVSD